MARKVYRKTRRVKGRKIIAYSKFGQGVKHKYNAYGRNALLYGSRPVSNVWTGLNGHPQSYMCALRYSDRLTMTSTTSWNQELYAVNNLFDPFQEAGGHQPHMFDVLSGLYNRYLVFGVKVEVEGFCSTNMYVGLVFQPKTTDFDPTDDLSLVKERKFTTIKMIPIAKGATRFTKYMSMAKLFGVSKKRIAINTDFDAPVTGNPGITGYVSVISIAYDEASSATFNGNVRLTYYTKFWDPTSQNQS